MRSRRSGAAVGRCGSRPEQPSVKRPRPLAVVLQESAPALLIRPARGHQGDRAAGTAHRHIHQLPPQHRILRPEHIAIHKHLREGAALAAVHREYGGRPQPGEGIPQQKKPAPEGTALLFAGLTSGAIYASLAVALVMVWRSTHHLNFAQGEMAMFSTYVALALIESGLGYWSAFFLTLVLSLVVSMIIERVIVAPISRAQPLASVIVFVALLSIFHSLAS